MITVLYNATGLLLMFLCLGVAWASVDVKLFVPVRRWWHKMTHKEPLPESDRRGFVVGQPAKRKMAVASFVSAIQSIYVWFYSDHANFLTEFLLWFLESGVMMFGFYLVKPFGKLKDFLVNRVASNLDRVEAGEVTMGGLAGEVASQAVDSVAETAEGVAQRAAAQVEEGVDRVRDAVLASRQRPEPEAVEEASEDASPKPPPEPAPEIDHRAVLERYKKGR